MSSMRSAPGTSGMSQGVLALLGIIAIIFGLALIYWQGETLSFLVLIIGIFAIIWGIIGAFEAIVGHTSGRRTVRLLISILAIIIGLILVAYPSITLTIVVYIVGIWALLSGILYIIAGFRATEYGARWIELATGIIIAIIGLVILLYPGLSLSLFAILVGIYAIIWGILLVAGALAVRR